MTNGSSLPYHLRPNKIVDREVFLDLLVYLNPILLIQDYEYIGLGGPFLADFRLLHSRLGMTNLTCIENDAETYRRQLFNRPGYVEPVFADLDQYLGDRDLSEKPCVIWLDFTGAANESNLELMASTVRELQPLSVVKVTFNAQGSRVERRKGENLSAFEERRVERAKADFGRYAPASLVPADLKIGRFGQVVLDSVRRALDAEMTGSARTYLGVNAFHYRDGAPIVTATVIPCDSSEDLISSTRLDRWEFFQPTWPVLQLIDMPELSSFERVYVDRLLGGRKTGFETSSPNGDAPTTPEHLEKSTASEEGDDADVSRGDGSFEMPSGSLGDKREVLDSFGRFARLYPHFARIEL